MRIHLSAVAALLLAGLVSAPGAFGKDKAKSMEQSRSEYLARLQQTSATPATTPGSLWNPDGRLANLAADYKAARLHDTVTILIIQQTTAQASGNSTAQRQFSTSSAITALPGKINVSGVNPLIGANSDESLKGQGQTSSSSKLQTTLTGEVIAVLPNGNLVLEAHRDVYMNHERETALVRGVVRPGDVSGANTVPSTALSNLEIELKGKGLISDATRRPNIVTRMLQWVVGF
jgi:flagellar L-ring protein precursor FlgH